MLRTYSVKRVQSPRSFDTKTRDHYLHVRLSNNSSIQSHTFSNSILRRLNCKTVEIGSPTLETGSNVSKELTKNSFVPFVNLQV